MSWYALISDIASRVEAEAREELIGEAHELQIAEEGTTSVVERLRGSLGRSIEIAYGDAQLAGVEDMWRAGRLIGVGEDWIFLRTQRGYAIVPIEAVRAVRGLTQVARPTSAIKQTMNAILRGLLGDVVRIESSGEVWRGELTRVGQDYLAIQPRAAADRWDAPSVGEPEVYLPLCSVACVETND